MSTLTAPPGGDRNRAGELNAVAWTWTAVSMVFVGLRVFSRVRITRNMWWDDWCMVLTLMLSIATTILWTILGDLNGCRHLYYLTPDQTARASRINWISQPPAIMSLAFGKISVALLILRIMGKSFWRKWFLYFTMISNFLFCALACIFTFVQCKPVEALWNPTLPGAKCWKPERQSDFSLFVGSWLAVMDIALAVLPTTIIWNLQLATHKKVGLSAVMGLGVFAFACAVIKTSKLPELNVRSDITWVTVTLWMWNANECNTVIIAACIPTLRPLFLIIFDRPGAGAYRNGHSNGYSGSHDRPNRIAKISAPISDSTTAIGQESHHSWIEIPDSDKGAPGKNHRIRQTIELDVTSRQASTSMEEEAIHQGLPSRVEGYVV